MSSPQSNLDRPTAWEEAEAAGFDMSVVEAKLEMSAWERIRAHSRALMMALALREAVQKCHAGT